jgi:hypothetical protein
MGRQGTRIGVVGLALGLMLVAGAVEAAAQPDVTPAGCPAQARVPTQLRALDCQLAEAIADGLARSSTFRRVVERVGALNGVVYIQARPYVDSRTNRVLDGALSHAVTTAGPYRVLRVLVRPQHGDVMVALLGHELQHVLEVLGALDASTEQDVDRLFERIGAQAFAGAVETAAATATERTIRLELSGRH